MEKNIFKNLIILDLANNHFGDQKHAKKIIDTFSKIIKKKKLNATIKFQFRDLDTFIHPNAINSSQKYVKRFLETKLSIENFEKLFYKIKKNNIRTACTPFDEISINLIEKMKFDFLKIASVSSQDFSLLERSTYNKIPKIISTGGLDLSKIDKIYSFFKKKKQNFALMHCVSIYPTNIKDLNIQVIKNLKERYPEIPIGWSTHESPEEYLPSAIALSSGAEIFERHIGINTSKYRLNSYSSSPKIFEKWVDHLQKSMTIYGSYSKTKINKNESKTINRLQRGVFAKENIKRGEFLTINKNIFLAFPKKEGQLSAEDFKDKKTKARVNFSKNLPIMKNLIKLDDKVKNEYKIRSYVHQAKAMLNYNKIKIADKFEMEISHHKGIKNFRKIGCFLLNLVNKKYAKKILIMLPNQKHPKHSHKIKEESFIINFGELTLNDNNKKYFLKEGDIIHLKKGSWHTFKSGNRGCIFEEISTTSFKNDSFYKEKKIDLIKRENRKTIINKWI